MRILIWIFLIGTAVSGVFLLGAVIDSLTGQDWISKEDMRKVDELIEKRKRKE